MSTEDQRAALMAKLDAVEAEMKRIGFWAAETPPPGRPFDMELKAWLQGTFLPNARAAVAADDLPDKSQVGTMAMREYDYMGTVEEALPLVQLLNEFDALILKAAPTHRSKRSKRSKP